MNTITTIHQEEVQRLQRIERDYQRLTELLGYASHGDDLTQYGGDAVLHVHQTTRAILYANANITLILGFKPEDVVALTIHDIELPQDENDTTIKRCPKASHTEQSYIGQYRHQDGHIVMLKVYQRVLETDESGHDILHYTLEDVSPFKTLWKELVRREDQGFQYREHLKHLNEVNLLLIEAKSFDDLCYKAVKLGMERLNFDRISIWHRAPNSNMMIGTYGVDEDGIIRNEHHIQWEYTGTDIMEFASGNRRPLVVNAHSEIYDHQSQIIGYGWHISVPLLNRGEFIGYMAADNYINRLPLQEYQTELLHLYGVTIGHLAALQLERDIIHERELELALEQRRVGVMEAFIRDIGHEFRTPLSIIAVRSYLLKKMDNPQKKATSLQEIESQVSKISDMLDDLMYMVKIENEPITCETMNLVIIETLFKGILEELSPSITAKALQVDLLVDENAFILANQPKLTRAIQELIKNAIQYSHPHGKISLQTRITDDGTVHLVVQDNGIGIAKEDLSQIFNRLYRADSARTTRGTGLGLSIAKAIIEAHGGTIHVTSQLHQGSVFEVRIPQA
jgi:signal transduction histidine kinase/PAS domain-containing protein